MKKNHIICALSIITFAVVCMPAFAQNTQQRQQRQAPTRGGQNMSGMMGFKHSPLEGVWQACNIKETGGQVHMQLVPCLKLVGSTGMYQDITIKTSAEGSVVTENGMYIQLNDSTFKREITACTDTVAAKKYNKTIRTEVQGNNWLVIAYASADGKESYQEVWKRISTTAPISMRGNFFRNNKGNYSGQGSSSLQRQRRSNANSSGNAFQEEINNAMKEMNDDSF